MADVGEVALGEADVPLETTLIWIYEALARARAPLVDFCKRAVVGRGAEFRRAVGDALNPDDPMHALQAIQKLDRIADDQCRRMAKVVRKEFRNAAMHEPEQLTAESVSEHLGALASLVQWIQRTAPAVEDRSVVNRLEGLKTTYDALRKLPLRAGPSPLLVMPCSAKKLNPADGDAFYPYPGTWDTQPVFGGDCLSAPTEAALRERRAERAAEGKLNTEAGWRYARDLYVGSAWTGTRLAKALEVGGAHGVRPHLLILSGGYGVVHYDDPLSHYDATFEPSVWGSAVGDAIAGYCRRHSIERVVWFGSATAKPVGGEDPYLDAARDVPWKDCGIVDEAVFLIRPRSRTNQPAASDAPNGEAIASLITRGEVPAGWFSTDGAVLEVTPLGAGA